MTSKRSAVLVPCAVDIGGRCSPSLGNSRCQSRWRSGCSIRPAKSESSRIAAPPSMLPTAQFQRGSATPPRPRSRSAPARPRAPSRRWPGACRAGRAGRRWGASLGRGDCRKRAARWDGVDARAADAFDRDVDRTCRRRGWPRRGPPEPHRASARGASAAQTLKLAAPSRCGGAR